MTDEFEIGDKVKTLFSDEPEISSEKEYEIIGHDSTHNEFIILSNTGQDRLVDPFFLEKV